MQKRLTVVYKMRYITLRNNHDIIFYGVGGHIESLSQWVMEWFTVYAYQPEIVYASVIALMLLSGFGLPLPEEVVIISSSLLAFMALHPDLYPPPEPGLRGVNVYVLAMVCFFAVLFSDFVVFQLGRTFKHTSLFQSLVNPRLFRRARFWTTKYGVLMVGVFRFIPGVRFPGHLACGALGIPPWKFLLVDMSVIFITIPTQVFLIAFFGEDILAFIKKFKLYIVAIMAVVIIYIVIKVFRTIRTALLARKQKRQAASLRKNV